MAQILGALAEARNTAGKPIFAIVGDADGLLVVLVAYDRHDRSEDLLLRDPHLVVDVVEKRGPVVVALAHAGRALPARDELGALLLPEADVLLDGIAL